MNSKERVRSAIQRKPPDRVPAAMKCVDAVWNKLFEAFHVSSPDAVMEALEIDIRSYPLPPYIGPELSTTINEKLETVYTHPLGYRYVNKWNGAEYNWHTVDHPLRNIETIKQLNAYQNWPNPDHFDYEAVKRYCDSHQDYAIEIGWPGPYQVFMELYPAQEFYMLMAEDPELVKAMLFRYSRFYMEVYERMLEAGDGAIDILRCCDDYGTQRGLLFSPSMWKDYFYDNTKKLADLAHKYGGFYMQHSCGAVRDIIPLLIECGVDILEPIQKVIGMEVDNLKQDFGSQIAFQGGVDTQHLLPFGTPEEVRIEAQAMIETMNKGGGYILAPSQDFEGDVPIENVLAVYESR